MPSNTSRCPALFFSWLRAYCSAPIKALERAESEAAASLDHARGAYAVVESSSERFNHWLRRSAADLRMLVSTTPYGEYPYAGVPWFSTPFGRDGIITALQTLWINPRIARGVLEYLAATQADRRGPAAGRRAGQDPARDAQRRDGRASAKCRSAATTAAWTRRRCSSCWPAPTTSAPATGSS